MARYDDGKRVFRHRLTDGASTAGRPGARGELAVRCGPARPHFTRKLVHASVKRGHTCEIQREIFEGVTLSSEMVDDRSDRLPHPWRNSSRAHRGTLEPPRGLGAGRRREL